MTKVKFLKYLRLIFNYDNFLPYPLENVELTAYIVADGLEIVCAAELRDLKFKIDLRTTVAVIFSGSINLNRNLYWREVKKSGLTI